MPRKKPYRQEVVHLDNKLLIIPLVLVLFVGTAFAAYSFNFNIDINNPIQSFQILLSGNLTQAVSGVSQNTLKYFLANGTGYSDTQTASTSIWDTNISTGQFSVEVTSLNQTGCDLKVFFDGKEYDINTSQPKLVFPITATGQRLSLGAYMKADGVCSGTIQDLNVVTQ